VKQITTKLSKRFYDIEKAVTLFLENAGISAFDNYNHRTMRVQLVVQTI
jgi:hypothetical protein